LDMEVSMVILRWLSRFGGNYKPVGLTKIALAALQTAIVPVVMNPVKCDPF
jgi:hypothetical protein